MTNLDYITNDYARGYVSSRWNARKGVHIPLSFIDICNGNMHDAILFSQIMYWHEPSQETGKTRLRRWHDGNLWLAKNHEDWYAECRVKKSTVRKCLERLKALDLIHYELHGEKGNKTPFIRMNWDTFARLMQAWELEHKPLNVVDIPVTSEHTPVTTGQGGLLPQDTPLSSEVIPNTETTTENTDKETPIASDDAQGTTTDTLDKSERDVWYDTVTDVFGLHAGRNVNMQKMLRGEATDTAHKPYNLDVPLTPDKVREWCKWWRDKYSDDISMVTSPMKVQSSIVEWQTEKKRPTIDRRLQARQLPANIDMLNTGEASA